MTPGDRREPASVRAPLTVVWHRQVLDYVLEAHFIHDVLLGALGRPLVVEVLSDERQRVTRDDTLFVVFENAGAEAVSRARAAGRRNLGVLHLADERGTADRRFYADADYVLRVYHHPEALTPPPHGHCRSVTWIPNGYRTGVGPSAPDRLPPTSHRPHLTFFAGQITGGRPLPEREAMIAAVQSLATDATVLVDTRRFGGGFSPQEYAAHLGRSRFALVPAGNVAETIRLYDALEQGCVPIMTRAAFLDAPTGLGGNVPFPVLDDWRDLPRVLAPFGDLDDDDAIAAIERTRLACLEWWGAFKARKRTEITHEVDAAFAANHPPQ